MKKELLLGLAMATGAAFAQEGVAPQIKTIENENTITMQQDSTSKDVADTLNRFDATGYDGKSIKTSKEEGNEKDSRIQVHGSARLGSNVTPLLGSVLSDKPALRLTIDASDTKTGIGASIIRFDDFDKSMDNLASQLTMLDLYCQKQFGKFSITGVGEYVHIDKMPGADSFTPIVGCTYDAGKGWKIDAWYCHTFQKGTDENDLRIGVTKVFNEAFSLAAQAFLKYNGNLNTSLRIQANVTLKNGIGTQFNFTAKDGKITPTVGVMYKF